MELYLFLSFVILYVLMSFFVSRHVQNKVWTLAFVVSFAVTAIAIAFLKVNNQDVMMSANELNWYYLLYLFGSMSVVLGIINIWMYRSAIISIFFEDDDEADEKDKD